MAFKLDRNHNDYLFWIYPLIIMGLLIFAIKRDEHNRESTVRTNTYFNPDSTLTKSTQSIIVDSLTIKEPIDSFPIFFATNKDD